MTFNEIKLPLLRHVKIINQSYISAKIPNNLAYLTYKLCIWAKRKTYVYWKSDLHLNNSFI